MSKEENILCILVGCVGLLASALIAYNFHRKALNDLFEDDEEDDIDWGAETVIINHDETRYPESEKIFYQMVGRAQRPPTKREHIRELIKDRPDVIYTDIDQVALKRMTDGFNEIINEKMEITIKPTYEELQQRLEVTLSALEKLQGIEVWIQYDPMRVLFHNTVYPAIAKGRGEDK